MKTKPQLQNRSARAFFLSLASIAISIAAAVPQEATAGDIVIFRKTESTKYVNYHTAYESASPFGGVTDVPGGRTKSSVKKRSYIVMNLGTGEYRELCYYTYREFDVISEKFYTVRTFDYSDTDEPLYDLFETGAEERRNYLVMSFRGSGSGDNFFADGSLDPYYLTTVETIAGTIKLQKIRTDEGIFECLAPSRLTGALGDEKREELEDGSEKKRRYGTGKVGLTLDKKRTREFLDADGSTLEEGIAVIRQYLNTKRYFDVF